MIKFSDHVIPWNEACHVDFTLLPPLPKLPPMQNLNNCCSPSPFLNLYQELRQPNDRLA